MTEEVCRDYAIYPEHPRRFSLLRWIALLAETLSYGTIMLSGISALDRQGPALGTSSARLAGGIWARSAGTAEYDGKLEVAISLASTS
jgi:hypothetical protein